MDDAAQSVTQPPAPPLQDEFPPGAVIGVVDDMAIAEIAIQAALPVSASAPYVLEASRVLALRAERDESQGTLRRLYLTLGAMVSDQQALQDRYIEEAELGHHMIVASAADDAQAEVVWEALKEAGVHTGLWLSGSTLRELL